MTRTRSKEPTAFEMLLAEVRALPIPQTTKERFFALFRQVEGGRLVVTRRELVQTDLVEAARRMLAMGYPRALVRTHMVTHHGVSRRTAYRIIGLVLAAGKRTEEVEHG